MRIEVCKKVKEEKKELFKLSSSLFEPIGKDPLYLNELSFKKYHFTDNE